jgi:hypothetical protein
LTEQERQRVLQVLAATILTLSPYDYAPPDNPPPMANAPPDTIPEGNPAPAGGPSGGGPNTSPEPATVLTGLLGSGLAGLFAYTRKRRQRRRMRRDAEALTDGLELAMAA